jgi:hypothetical protein
VIANNYLAERGITEATVEEFDLEIEEEPAGIRFQGRLGFDRWNSQPLAELVEDVIWFPCRDADGKTVSWIARVFPLLDEAKFLTPKGGTLLPFVPPQTWAVKEKPNKPLILTEGPVKALAIYQAGQLPIGLGGVWMATKKGADGSIELVPDLKQFKWFGRQVYLAFDADWTTNPSVRQALFRTFLALYRQAAKVRFVSWPISQGKGIDDYLHAKTETGEPAVKGLAAIIEAAGEIGQLVEPEDLTVLQSELKLANLSGAQRSQISRILAEPLKVRASALEADAAREETETVARTFTLADPEPWPEPVDGAELVREIVKLTRRYIVISEAEATAAALWVLLTFLDTHVDTLPILAITSPQKRCGKTTLLTILSRLARKALPSANVSPAALFRSIEKFWPTLLIDEADTFLKDNEELRGILNAGHTRDFAFVLRSNPDTLEPERFSTWAPKAIACIGRLPETLSDRSIEIRLERRIKTESVEKLRDADPKTFARLQRMALRWSLDHGQRVRQAHPVIPPILNDRAGDNWWPMLSIASVAGVVGVDKAALKLSVDRADEESVSLMLLSALRDLFSDTGADFLPTEGDEGILAKLNKDAESPWADWKKGMTAEKLGRTLKAFNVKSERPRREGKQERGYSLEVLQPVFGRYLSPNLPSPPENDPQPGSTPGDQVLEPLEPEPGSKTHLGSGQDENSTRLTANQVLEPIREGVSQVEPENGGWARKESLNGSNPAKPVASCKARMPSLTDAEQRIIDALFPWDYEGGLTYTKLLEFSKMPDELFDRELKSLVRRGLVFKSALTDYYALKSHLAELLRDFRTAPSRV